MQLRGGNFDPFAYEWADLGCAQFQTGHISYFGQKGSWSNELKVAQSVY